MNTNDQNQAYTDPKKGEVPDNNSQAASEGEVRSGDKALGELDMETFRLMCFLAIIEATM